MKRKFSILFVLITVVLAGLSIKTKAADMTIMNNSSNPSPLGKSINTVEAESLGSFASRDVLSSDYYFSMMYYDVSYFTESEFSTIYETSRNSALASVQQKYSCTAYVNNLPIKMFTLNARGSFSESLSISESSFVSNVWYNIYSKKIYGEKYLFSEYYGDSYKYHLSPEYLTALNRLASGSMSYEDFFRSFGTHIITKFRLGDEFNMDTSIHTNSQVIDSDLGVQIGHDIKAGIKKISGGVKDDSELMAKYSMESDKTVIITSCHTLSALSCDMFDNPADSFNDWNRKTSKENSTIIDYPSDGLLPLWEFLPDDSPVTRKTMEEKFIEYANKKECKYPVGSSTHQFPETISGNCYSRSTDIDITDKDRFSNTIDYFRVPSKYGLSLLKTKYKYLDITLTFDVKKDNQGTRYVYVYNKADAYTGSKNHNNQLAFTNKITCDKKGKRYKGRTVTLRIDTCRLSSYDLALVWRASGNGNDTWHNGNLSVKYKFYN